jgi:hypothetical protein
MPTISGSQEEKCDPRHEIGDAHSKAFFCPIAPASPDLGATLLESFQRSLW